MRVSDQIISKLRVLKEDNSISSYSHIKNILKNQKLLVAFFELKPFKLIRHRRHNNGEDFFENIEDLTYRKDILNIRSFGRANEPGQGLFYCNDNYNQETGMSEAMSILRGNKDSQEEILTASAWNLNDTLKLVMILPSEEYSGKNKEFDEMKTFYNSYEDSEEFNELKNLNEFLSQEFTLDLEKHKSNYKITCAYTNYIKERFEDVDGIIYASIKSEFEGTNIVLWPEVVEKKVEFLAARKQVIKRISEKTFMEVQVFENKGFDKSTGEIFWK